MSELSYKDEQKTCDRCVYYGKGDQHIGDMCYLCKRNPVDNRIDWFEEKKENNLINLLQDENNPVHWIFMNNSQISKLAEYLEANGVVVMKEE